MAIMIRYVSDFCENFYDFSIFKVST
jgi:hypothetical protein